uniref:Uncharacterized protein n=1 Tax=Oryza rufipogon TaxID=4529 RepID=A0A0E0MUY6_ORYRU
MSLTRNSGWLARRGGGCAIDADGVDLDGLHVVVGGDQEMRCCLGHELGGINRFLKKSSSALRLLLCPI